MKNIIRSTVMSACLAFCVSQTSFATDSQTAAAFTPAQITQLHQIIHDYLVKDPQVLVDASKALQAQQEKKAEASAMIAIVQNKAALFEDAQSPVIGNKNAPVTVVEFFDYQCGHCKEMTPIIEKLVSQDKNVRVIFKELPIFGKVSANAAKIALASAMQSPEKYYAFHDALLAAQEQLTTDTIMKIAAKTGLDVAKLKTDMDSPVISKEIRDNFKLAQSLKVMGTPTFVISNKAQTKFAYIPGATSFDELQNKIKSVQ